MTKASFSDRLRRPVRQLHWISAAICVFSLCFYAVSGFILNNEEVFKAKPYESRFEKPLSPELALALQALSNDESLDDQSVSKLSALFGYDMRYAKARLTKGKLSLTIPEPGVKAAIEVDTKANKLIYDRAERGPLAFMTDLHKGKNVRPLWKIFINVLAISVLVFALSGLALLFYQARARKVTWPLIGFGIVAPAAFILLLMHL
jgi:uncharacterized protein